jgi:hypothetical protein
MEEKMPERTVPGVSRRLFPSDPTEDLLPGVKRPKVDLPPKVDAALEAKELINFEMRDFFFALSTASRLRSLYQGMPMKFSLMDPAIKKNGYGPCVIVCVCVCVCVCCYEKGKAGRLTGERPVIP